jgi:hypothetical protein
MAASAMSGRAGALLLALLAAPAAQAGIIANADCLPPSNGAYVGQFHQTYSGPGFVVDLSSPVHSAFTACLAPPSSGSQLHSFLSTLEFDISINGGPPLHQVVNGVAVTVDVAFVQQVGSIRFFDTEMVQLDIVGGTLPPGVMVRESPTQASTGQTSIETLGGGLYRIDSFFDVFTELTLDGGQNWLPSNPPSGRVTLVPEPTTMATFGAGLIGLWLARRRLRVA